MTNAINLEKVSKAVFMGEVKRLYSRIHEIEKYEFRFDIMFSLLSLDIENKQAAGSLNVSIGHVKKMKKWIRENGFNALIHSAKGKEKEKKFTADQVKLICSLYNGNYAKDQDKPRFDFSHFSYQHFLDHLVKPTGDLYFLGIDISYTTLRNILIKNGLRSENTQAFRKEHNSNGRQLGKVYMLGERWELDGKFGDWFGTGEVLCAHNIYCRGISKPIASFFDKEETTYGYMMAFGKAVTKFGVPQFIVSDNRSTFRNVAAVSEEEKYNTRFNDLLDSLGVKYEYSSNANAKPGVERWNATMGERVMVEVVRLGLTTIEELNEWIDDYISFEQGDAVVNADKSKLGAKIPMELYVRHAILVRDKFTITSNNRIVKKKVEYELMKDGQLRTFPKGKQGYFLKDINGQLYAEIDNVRYDLEISINVDKAKYNKDNIRNYVRKVRENGTIRIDSKEYILIQNSGEHVEAATGCDIKISHSEKEMIGQLNAKTYKVIELESYEQKQMIRTRKECKLKYHCMFQYEGFEHVAVKANGRLKYFDDDEKGIFVRYSVDGLYGAVKDERYRVIKRKELDLSIDPVPDSNAAAKRLRNL